MSDKQIPTDTMSDVVTRTVRHGHHQEAAMPERFRTGTKPYAGHLNHCTLYVQAGPEPAAEDEIIGVADDPVLARLIVTVLNGEPVAPCTEWPTRQWSSAGRMLYARPPRNQLVDFVAVLADQGMAARVAAGLRGEVDRA